MNTCKLPPPGGGSGGISKRHLKKMMKLRAAQPGRLAPGELVAQDVEVGALV